MLQTVLRRDHWMHKYNSAITTNLCLRVGCRAKRRLDSKDIFTVYLGMILKMTDQTGGTNITNLFAESIDQLQVQCWKELRINYMGEVKNYV